MRTGRSSSGCDAKNIRQIKSSQDPGNLHLDLDCFFIRLLLIIIISTFESP
jgi:hypothetical protein